MGYTLKIGEAKIHWDEDSVSVGVEDQKHDNAPGYGEPTDYENQRWPSYTSWYEFATFAGLGVLFPDSQPHEKGNHLSLMPHHPGSVPLLKKHQEFINRAYDAFKWKYPKAAPTYGETKEDDPFWCDPMNPECNGQLCRLEWLKYWVDWALENCERPVFYNS